MDAVDDAPPLSESERSPVSGMDWETLQNYVMRALDGDPTVSAVILNLVNAGGRAHSNIPEEQDGHAWRTFFWRQGIESNLKAIDDLINRYGEMADWHHERAEQARARMSEAAEKLAAVDEFITGVNEALKVKESGGALDRDRAIRLLAGRGITVDPNDDEAALLTKLEVEKKKALEERRRWSDQYDTAKVEADYNDRMEQANRKKAQELTARREEIRNSGLDVEEEARRLQQVADEYGLDVQTKAAELEHNDGKNILDGSMFIG